MDGITEGGTTITVSHGKVLGADTQIQARTANAFTFTLVRQTD